MTQFLISNRFLETSILPPSSTDQECCKVGVITLSQYTALKWGLGEGRNAINEVLLMGKNVAFKPHDTPQKIFTKAET